MTFGERITYKRKQHKWSQDELAKKVGTSAPIIGRYERDEIKPSIEVATKIADALGVTIDYLVKDGETAAYDKETVRRLSELQKLPNDEQTRVFEYMDLIIRDYNTKKAYK